MFDPIVLIHLIGGIVVILSGFLILPFRKGGKNHKYIGITFMSAMLVLGLTGVYVAFARSIMISLINGLFISYFVLSAWSAIKRPPNTVYISDLWMVATSTGLAVALIWFAKQAADSATGKLAGFGPEAFIFFGAVAVFCAAADIRYILIGGLSGNRRVTRHLWRMFFPFLMAVTAFFLGQAKLFPPVLRQMEYLVLPTLAVVIALAWWLFRVKFTSPWKTMK